MGKSSQSWLYRIGTGGSNPVRHAIRRDIPQLAECGARGPFITAAIGEPKDCHVCQRIVGDFAGMLSGKHEAAEMGRRGGQARAKALTATQRTLIARDAAKSRWRLTAVANVTA